MSQAQDSKPQSVPGGEDARLRIARHLTAGMAPSPFQGACWDLPPVTAALEASSCIAAKCKQTWGAPALPLAQSCHTDPVVADAVSPVSGGVKRIPAVTARIIFITFILPHYLFMAC